MTLEEFLEIMKELEEEYDYLISNGMQEYAKNILYEMKALEANYGKGG